MVRLSLQRVGKQLLAQAPEEATQLLMEMVEGWAQKRDSKDAKGDGTKERQRANPEDFIGLFINHPQGKYDGKLTKARDGIQINQLAADQWWWD